MPLHPNRLRWTEKQITIHVEGKSRGTWVLKCVYAKVYGDMAVFRLDEDSHWSATAVQTGLAVCHFDQEQDAKRCTEELQHNVSKALRQTDADKMRILFPQRVYDWVKACYQSKSYQPLPAPGNLFA